MTEREKTGWRCLNIVMPLERREEPPGDRNECWDERIRQWLNSGRFVGVYLPTVFTHIPATAVLLASREDFSTLVRVYTWRDDSFPPREEGHFVPCIWWEPA